MSEFGCCLYPQFVPFLIEIEFQRFFVVQGALSRIGRGADKIIQEKLAVFLPSVGDFRAAGDDGLFQALILRFKCNAERIGFLVILPDADRPVWNPVKETMRSYPPLARRKWKEPSLLDQGADRGILAKYGCIGKGCPAVSTTFPSTEKVFC